MPSNPIPLKTILSLYQYKKWSVPKIAAHFAVTRQAVYERIRNSDAQLDPVLRLKRIDPEALRKIVKEPIPVAEMARRLGVSIRRFGRELKFNGIERSSSQEWRRKQPKIYDLPPGRSLLVPKNDPNYPCLRSLYKIAERSGFKITVKTVDDQNYRVTRRCSG